MARYSSAGAAQEIRAVVDLFVDEEQGVGERREQTIHPAPFF